MGFLTDEQRDEIIQIVKQVVQTSGQSQSGSTHLGYTSHTEDTQTDEAIRGKSYNDSEMWSVNKKLTVAQERSEVARSADFDRNLKSLEIKEKELALAEREAKLRHQAKLDAIAASERENAALIKHLANSSSIDFKMAVNESQLPLVDDDQTVKNENK